MKKTMQNKSSKFPWLKVIGIGVLYIVLFYALIFITAPFVDDNPSDAFLCVIFILPAILIAVIMIGLKTNSSKQEKQIAAEKEAAKSHKKEKFYITGTAYHKSNINKLAVANPDWKSTKAKLAKDGKLDCDIYRYNYVNKPVKLIPEPTNEHDPNAIFVMIAGEKVGYITREDNKKVRYILNECEIEYISAFIGGGEYKYVNNDDVFEKDERPFSISVTISYFG